MIFNPIFHSNCEGIQINFKSSAAFEPQFKTEDPIQISFRSSDQNLNASFQCLQKITVIGDVDHYEGSYDVTPLITSQILPTNQKYMDDDVRIDMIPTREIQNASGGITFIVG